MECDRKMIYLSFAETENREKRAGYVVVFVHGERCEVQIFYNGKERKEQVLRPVYVLKDGVRVQGEEITVTEGMAAVTIPANRMDFMHSGISLDCLNAFYLESGHHIVCGGRPDGQEPFFGRTVIVPESLRLEYTEEEQKQNQPGWRPLRGGNLCRCRRPGCRNL